LANENWIDHDFIEYGFENEEMNTSLLPEIQRSILQKYASQFQESILNFYLFIE
jgi:hypothetical protein